MDGDRLWGNVLWRFALGAVVLLLSSGVAFAQLGGEGRLDDARAGLDKFRLENYGSLVNVLPVVAVEKEPFESKKENSFIDEIRRRLIGTLQVAPTEEVREHLLGAYPGVPISDRANTRIDQCNPHSRAYSAELERLNRNEIAAPNPQLVDEHDKHCLEPLGDADASIRDRIGVLYSRSTGEFFCTAFLVDSRHVMTARHCFRDPSSRPLLPSDVTFYRLTAPDSAHTLSGLFRPSGAAEDFFDVEQDTDYIVASLDEALPVEGTLRLGSVKESDRIEVPGFHYVLAYYGSRPLVRTPGALPSDASWAKFMRKDSLDTCRVGGLSRCLFHSCQTDGGWSGAPILALDPAGRINHVAGVHSGGITTGSRCMPSARPGDRRYTALKMTVLNAGSIPSAEWLDQATRP